MTDMAKHFNFVKDMSAMLDKFREKGTWDQLRAIVSDFSTEEDTSIELLPREDRLTIMEAIIKVADINNPSKPRPISLEWVNRVMEEFYRQGDLERERGMPISSFFDRENPQVAKCQKGFITFFIQPFFKPWFEFLNTNSAANPILQQLSDNLNYWEQCILED